MSIHSSESCKSTKHNLETPNPIEEHSKTKKDHDRNREILREMSQYARIVKENASLSNKLVFARNHLDQSKEREQKTTILLDKERERYHLMLMKYASILQEVSDVKKAANKKSTTPLKEVIECIKTDAKYDLVAEKENLSEKYLALSKENCCANEKISTLESTIEELKKQLDAANKEQEETRSTASLREKSLQRNFIKKLVQLEKELMTMNEKFHKSKSSLNEKTKASSAVQKEISEKLCEANRRVQELTTELEKISENAVGGNSDAQQSCERSSESTKLDIIRHGRMVTNRKRRRRNVSMIPEGASEMTAEYSALTELIIKNDPHDAQPVTETLSSSRNTTMDLSYNSQLERGTATVDSRKSRRSALPSLPLSSGIVYEALAKVEDLDEVKIEDILDLDYSEIKQQLMDQTYT